MIRPGPARPDAIRRHNLGLVLEQVHRRGELSRAALTQSLGFNRSTIRALVADLTELDLVREHVPVGRVRAGRPSHLVGPRPDGPYVMAVEVEVDSVVVAAVGLGGAVLARREHDLLAGRTTAAEVADLIHSELQVLPDAVPPGAWLVGAGVSIPGTIRADGRVDQAPNLHWRDQPFGGLLRERIPSHVPIRLGNDANLGALAEHQRGAAQDAANCVYLSGKVGVGGGVIADGTQLTGAGGFAGEIGHMVLDPAGPPCSCGSNGCLETLVGEEALLRLCGHPGPVTREAVAEVFAAAWAGDSQARNGVREVAALLGLALSNLVNLFNPSVIVLGGRFSVVLELAADVIEAQLDQRAMGSARGMTVLRPPALGDDSSLIGAAELAFRPLLADPTAFFPQAVAALS